MKKRRWLSGRKTWASQFSRLVGIAASGVLLAGSGASAAGPAVGTIGTIAGTGVDGYNGEGTATSAQLNYPSGTAVDAAGNVYIADQYNHRIRRVTAAGVISTLAGTGVEGFSGDGGPATSAQFDYPTSVALDAAGNVYVADQYNHRIRRISTSGTVTTVAGNGTAGFSGDGAAATSAQLNFPAAVAVDTSGSIYIVDEVNQRIRVVNGATGVISTVAGTGASGSGGDGGAATAAQFNYPEGIWVDAAGNIFVADTSNHRVRTIAAGSGVITTVAGTGTAGFSGDLGAATSAQLNYPAGLVTDSAGNLFVADRLNNRVRKIAAATGIITTVAGTGVNGFAGDGGAATSAQFAFLNAVALDTLGNLYIADTYNHRVREAVVALPAPGNLRFTRPAVTSATLSWSPVPGASSYIVKRGTSPGSETVLASNITTTSHTSSGTFGTRYYYLVSAVSGAYESPNSVEVTISLDSAALRSDADGDSKSDILLYRPSNGYWYFRNSSANYAIGAGNWIFQWGASGDVPMSADYDGDGRLDPAVYRPSAGQWFIRYSTLGYSSSQIGYFEWGALNDVPLTSDFDGDKKSDIAVYRPTTGNWYLRLSTLGYAARVYTWGALNDTPKLADFDGDGKTDLTVYRATTGQWFVRYSSLNYDASQFGYFEWGATGDQPLIGDFDGDNRTDVTVYRPASGMWFIRYSSEGYAIGAGVPAYQWGALNDEPKTGDFDGDGKTDIAVYRPSTGQWFIRYSSLGYDANQFGYFEWGATNDVALPSN